jgi:L-ascorbate peroxidase
MAQSSGEKGVGMPGGISWTKHWLTFDNSFFQRADSPDDPDLLLLETDRAVFTAPEFQAYSHAYATDQDLFFRDYAVAHKKMSELGAKFFVPGGISIEQ